RRLVRRVVGGEPGVGVRRDLFGRHGVGKADQVSFLHLEVLSKAAVPGDAWNEPFSQCMSLPRRQAAHAPSVMSGWTVTASPRLKCRTSARMSSTQPAFS